MQNPHSGCDSVALRTSTPSRFSLDFGSRQYTCSDTRSSKTEVTNLFRVESIDAWTSNECFAMHNERKHMMSTRHWGFSFQGKETRTSSVDPHSKRENWRVFLVVVFFLIPFVENGPRPPKPVWTCEAWWEEFQNSRLNSIWEFQSSRFDSIWENTEKKFLLRQLRRHLSP